MERGTHGIGDCCDHDHGHVLCIPVQGLSYIYQRWRAGDLKRRLGGGTTRSGHKQRGCAGPARSQSYRRGLNRRKKRSGYLCAGNPHVTKSGWSWFNTEADPRGPQDSIMLSAGLIAGPLRTEYCPDDWTILSLFSFGCVCCKYPDEDCLSEYKYGVGFSYL